MELNDTYKTIELPTQGLYKEKGSKFMSFAYPIFTEDAIKSTVEELRKEYHDARHHCFAYIIGSKADKWRINDDGEPSGTAGKPIYGQLLSYGLTNVLVVVVRYFGGTKLGVSGLINAYKQATCDALNSASIVTRTVDDLYNISFGYLVMNEVMKIIKDMNLTIDNQQFDNSCLINLRVRRSLSEEFLSRLKKVESVNVEVQFLE